jgi:excisionase family DNA binding protein
MGNLTPRSETLRAALEQPKDDSAQVPILFTIAEASTYLRISKNTVYGLLRTNELKAVRIGRRRLIQASELQRFVTQREDAVYTV